ncbi:MAG: Nif3-like dinuclear metal center hexameric protein [Ruminococcaceae bacterium]|nr:Nif3-like dinuclear metal center hexameric protein [Oscillospiraceae bacterium]
MKIYEITNAIEQYAPKAWASSYDNVGLMLGDRNRDVTAVLLTLDVDLGVAMEAKAMGAELIISHHPLIFNPVKNITADSPEGKCLLYLAENKIAVYSAHTNLDSAPGGLNDLAAGFLRLSKTAPLEEDGDHGIGRIGELPARLTLEALAAEIKRIYRLSHIRFIGRGDREVRRVALCTGSGGDLYSLAQEKGADAYITGDIKYNVARDAAASGLAVIELGHYESEYIVVDLLEKIITDYAGIHIPLYKSRANKNVFTDI